MCIDRVAQLGQAEQNSNGTMARCTLTSFRTTYLIETGRIKVAHCFKLPIKQSSTKGPSDGLGGQQVPAIWKQCADKPAG